MDGPVAMHIVSTMWTQWVQNKAHEVERKSGRKQIRGDLRGGNQVDLIETCHLYIENSQTIKTVM